MSNVIKIKRGVDIKLVGEVEKDFAPPLPVETAAIIPDDFHGVRMKLTAREGDEVKAGTPIFYSRNNEQIKFCSPVSGEIAQVVRGAKRKILEVRVLADKETSYEDFGAADPDSLEREDIVNKLTSSGCWPFIRQRPYNCVADTEQKPKAIFISGFDSAPLAPDMEMILDGQEEAFQAGINVLSKLTDGKIHLGLNAAEASPKIFTDTNGINTHRFEGPHPAGVVGVQIAKIDPINKGETVWTLTPEHVVIIGRLFLTGKFDARINFAMTGSEVHERKYHQTILGASVKHFVKDNITEGNNRIITGNVLTGRKITEEGYLGWFERQVTVIPESDEPELFGWVIPKPDKFSMSRTLPSWFMRKLGDVRYKLDTGQHGERRAFVVTGQYEKVFPFDIYPVQLLKSIITNDIEGMENLGIYEVVEEDFALCEVVCTSKIPVQNIVREGLDLMKKELG